MRLAFVMLAGFPLLCVAPPAAADARYLGLAPPRGVPERFAPRMRVPFMEKPGFTATSPAFSPDFRRFTFTAVDARNPAKVALAIHEAMQEGGEWSEPALAPALASAGFTAGEGAFAADGRWSISPQLSPDGAVLFFLRRVDGLDRIFWLDLASVLAGE
jgi:hypothetical protein